MLFKYLWPYVQAFDIHDPPLLYTPGENKKYVFMQNEKLLAVSLRLNEIELSNSASVALFVSQ